ncbi:MAG: hypothetical protein V1495_07060 [Pseudomonadota bacterium]
MRGFLGTAVGVFLLFSVAYGAPVAREPRQPERFVDVNGQRVGVFSHPRLWLDPARIARLKTKAVFSNPIWVALENTNASQIQNGAYQKAAYSTLLLNFAVGYLASGRGAYLRAAKALLANFPVRFDLTCDGSEYCGNANLDYGSETLMHIAVAYDWLSSDLTDAEKGSIRGWVFTRLIPFLRKHPYYGDPTHNLGHTKWIGEFLWSLATLGEDGRAEAIFKEQYAFWNDRVAPLFDQYYPGGHTFGGSGYGYNRSFKFALYGMEAMTTATTIDGYRGHPWALQELLYRIHSVLPSRDSFHADWESAEALFNLGRQTENEALLVRRFQGTREAKIGQYFLNQVFRPQAYANRGGNRVHPYYSGLWFLWYDPADPELPYLDDPTAYVAPGLGVGFTRTSWSDRKSAWASLSSSSYVGDHQLHNEGSFKIWKNGQYLVIENGRCYAANSGDGTPTDANILFLGDGDVGRWRSAVTGGLPRRGDTSQAEISHFSQQSSYAYFEGDLSKAYVPSKFPLRFFHRIFTHFRAPSGSPNDYFVVADRIDSAKTMTKRSFIHLPKRPQLSGRDATLILGEARLNLRSLLPENATVSRDPVVKKSGGCLPQEEGDQPSRVTVSAPAGKEDFHLTVFQAGSAASAMPETETISSGKLIGVLIKDPVLNRVLVVSVDAAELSGALTFTCHPTGKTEFVVADLPPGTKYDVTIAGSSVTLTPSSPGQVRADDKGVLHF